MMSATKVVFSCSAGDLDLFIRKYAYHWQLTRCAVHSRTATPSARLAPSLRHFGQRARNLADPHREGEHADRQWQ